LDKVTENAEVDIPEAMIDTELDQMMKEFDQRLQMQGMTLEQYFQFSGQSEEELKEQMKNDAAARVKTNLTLESIVKEEDLEVTENSEVDIPEAMIDTELDQMMKEFDQRLQMQGMTLEQYFQFSGQSEEELKEQMKNDAAACVNTNLTLESSVKEEDVEVTEED